MKINPNTGFYDVQPGETITICVTAIDTAYVASFPPAPSCTAWSNTQGPAGGKECRQFVAPAAGTCVVAINFDFQSNASGTFPPGAKYKINVSGSAGGSHEGISVEPPPPQARDYTFNVV